MIARVRKRASKRTREREREKNERAPYGPVCVLVVSGSCGSVGGCACLQ
jgi:hypothetical protein